MDYKKIIGMRINAALALRNVKQKDLAEFLGIQNNSISYFCSGARTPNTELIIKMAQYLNVSTDYLLGITDVPSSDKDIKFVCEYTGLSPEAIENIVNIKNMTFEKINEILIDESRVEYINAQNLIYQIDRVLKSDKLIQFAFRAEMYEEISRMYEEMKNYTNEQIYTKYPYALDHRNREYWMYMALRYAEKDLIDILQTNYKLKYFKYNNI